MQNRKWVNRGERARSGKRGVGRTAREEERQEDLRGRRSLPGVVAGMISSVNHNQLP